MAQACHPERKICVAEIAVSCDGSGLCPSGIRTGDACPAEGAYIACVDTATDCSGGCRTCEDGTWSTCTGGLHCTLGELSSCGSCEEDCRVDVVNAEPTCEGNNSTFVCSYAGACLHGFVDADAEASNGCECNKTRENEICNGVDDDCDGEVDNDALDCAAFYYDADDDGAGLSATTQCACAADGLYRASTGADCDDDDALSYPGAPELCDGNDNSCNGSLDGTETDGDGDGYVTCADWDDGQDDTPAVLDGGDCNDAVSGVSPGAVETCDAGNVDENCNGLADDNDPSVVDIGAWYVDGDGDTYGKVTDAPVASCEAQAGRVQNSGDCDDVKPAIKPGAAELCAPAGVDEDCDGLVDAADAGVTGATRYYVDQDGDAYRLTADSGTLFCPNALPTSGYTTSAENDCNDSAAAINPAASESCSTPGDDNCDGNANGEGSLNCTWYYRDADDDDFGTDADGLCLCSPTALYMISQSGDCSDDDNQTYPGAPELCDGRDNDCAGVDANESDGDSDGYLSCTPFVGVAAAQLLGGGDCDDNASLFAPGMYHHMIRVKAGGAKAAGTILAFDFNHSAAVALGLSAADGSDVFVLYWSGAGWQETNRTAAGDDWNDTATRVRYQLVDPVPVGTPTQDYALVYGNTLSGIPMDPGLGPAIEANVTLMGAEDRCFQADVVVRYYLDEAAGGGVAGQLMYDWTPAPLDLIVREDSGLSYTTFEGHRGLYWTAVEGAGRVGAAIGADSELRARMDGQGAFTLEMVVDVNATTPAAPLIHIGNQSAVDIALIVDVLDANNDLGLGFEGNAETQWAVSPTALGRVVLHVVVDSSQAAAADRARLYVDGDLAAQQTFGAPGQDANVSLHSAASLVLGNYDQAALNMSPAATIFYVAIYDTALSALVVAEHSVLLQANDDLSAP